MAILLGGVSCGGADPSTDTSRNVHGVVEDARSGRRLKGVSVTFRSDTLDSGHDTTDGDGQYRLLVATDAESGRLELKRSGYATRVVSVFFDSDEVQVDVTLTQK